MKYARKCSFTGRGMNSGYVINEGQDYVLEAFIQEWMIVNGYHFEEELKTVNTEDEWFYWTEWEEVDDEEWFDSEGNTCSWRDGLHQIEGGDGVEYELWENKYGEGFRIPIEIKRDFESKEAL